MMDGRMLWFASCSSSVLKLSSCFLNWILNLFYSSADQTFSKYKSHFYLQQVLISLKMHTHTVTLLPRDLSTFATRCWLYHKWDLCGLNWNVETRVPAGRLAVCATLGIRVLQAVPQGWTITWNWEEYKKYEITFLSSLPCVFFSGKAKPFLSESREKAVEVTSVFTRQGWN